jgi:hypothetical protein
VPRLKTSQCHEWLSALNQARANYTAGQITSKGKVADHQVAHKISGVLGDLLIEKVLQGAFVVRLDALNADSCTRESLNIEHDPNEL